MQSQGPEFEDSPPLPDKASEKPNDGRDLFERLYAELRSLADRQMRQERPGLTLQPTALVHEAFLRIMSTGQSWPDERYLYAAAAEAMRRILTERARRVSRTKHGGGRTPRPLDNDLAIKPPPDPDALLSLHHALDDLRAYDPRLADIVMLRYFAGLTVERIGQILGRSERSVKYDWAAARAWLIRRMASGKEPSGG